MWLTMSARSVQLLSMLSCPRRALHQKCGEPTLQGKYLDSYSVCEANQRASKVTKIYEGRS